MPIGLWKAVKKLLLVSVTCLSDYLEGSPSAANKISSCSDGTDIPSYKLIRAYSQTSKVIISVVSTYASDEVRGSINKSLKVGQVLYLYELETSAFRIRAYCPYAAIPYLGIDHLDGANCARATRRPHAGTSPLIVTCQH